MELEWESDFETGNEDVDLQHRYFLDLINRIRKSFSGSNVTLSPGLNCIISL